MNADAVASRGLVVALADGVGDTPGARHAALTAATAAVAVPAAAGTAAALIAAAEAVRADPSAGDAVLAVVQPHGPGFRIGWVGDVRVHAWDGLTLRQLTTDHTLAQYFRDRGEPVAARMEHVVTTSVRTAAPERFGHVALASRERLVLTTDGVHKTLTNHAMAAILREAGNAAVALVAAAAGGSDNATAVVIEHVGLPPTNPLPTDPLPVAA